jgi:hypothetical protein
MAPPIVIVIVIRHIVVYRTNGQGSVAAIYFYMGRFHGLFGITATYPVRRFYTRENFYL